MSVENPPSPPSRTFVQLVVREQVFLIILVASFMVAAVTFRMPHIAMWVGFVFAGYSAVANDSIQTLGTFIASNREQKWWILWLYIGGIFLATMIFGWLRFDGDISWQRLTSKGFEHAPTSFSFLQIAAPLFLLIITRLRMPVSTSILLLSCFATDAKGITDVLMKSVGGYGIAFVVSLLLWGTLGRWMARRFSGPAHPAWRVGQWLTTGWLWAVWLAQDAANIAVYLPRSLNVFQMAAFCLFIFLGLGLLFFQRGEKIQEVVDEKSSVTDVRPACVIDFVYGAILVYKMFSSTIPMSTTWVFIGLLSGRELALTWWRTVEGRTMGGAVTMMVRDLLTVITGLVISLILAVVINDVVRHAWLPNAFDAEGAACVHIQQGAPRGVDASSEAIDPESVDDGDDSYLKPHRRNVVALGAVDGGFEGWVGFEVPEAGVTSLLSTAVVEIELIGVHGSVALESRGSSEACGPVDAWFTANLPPGPYVARLRSAEAEATVVIEQ